jgi:hypothetical protein
VLLDELPSALELIGALLVLTGVYAGLRGSFERIETREQRRRRREA